jgi:hypothetical protein
MTTIKTSNSISKTPITSENLNRLRKSYQDVLDKVHREMNMPGVVSIGKITYTSTSFRFKLEFTAQPVLESEKSGEVPAMTNDEILFRQKATKFGFSPDDYGRHFLDSSDQLCRVVSINSKKRKYPVICAILSSGQRFCATTGFVLKRLREHSNATVTPSEPAYGTCKVCQVAFKKIEYFPGLQVHANCIAVPKMTMK